MNTPRATRKWLAIISMLLLAATASTLAACSFAGSDSEAGVGSGPNALPSATKDSLAPAPSQYDAAQSPEGAIEQSAGESASPASTATQERLVVKSGSIRLQVKNIDATLRKLRSVTSTFGGTIDDLQVSTQTDQPIYRPLAADESADTVPLGAYATIRVPSDRAEEFTRRVAALGTVLRQSTSQSDVTQQHIDLSARLKNLRAEEVRLREFLRAAKNVEEMLLVETELSRVRGEIESLQGQLDYLDRQIEYATLAVELTRPAPVVRPTGTNWGFADALTNGIQGAAGVIRSIITVTIAVLPLALVALLAFFAIRAVLRRRSLRRGAVEDAETGIAPDDDFGATDTSQVAAPRGPVE